MDGSPGLLCTVDKIIPLSATHNRKCITLMWLAFLNLLELGASLRLRIHENQKFVLFINKDFWAYSG